MYCRNCGKEVDEKAVVCIHCGCAINENVQPPVNPEYEKPKTGIGAILGAFLGLIGLVIGVCMFPEGTVARKTFMKGWMIAFFIELGFAILSYVFILVIVMAGYGAGGYYLY